MNRKYILLLLLSASLFPAIAQEGFHLGAVGTFNTTWIINQNNYGTLAPFKIPIVRRSEMDYVKTWGGNTGVELGYNFTDNWGLQGEILYNNTGQHYLDRFDGPAYVNGDTIVSKEVEVERKITLHYLQIPIMAKFQYGKGDVAKFMVMAGPQIGALLGAREEVTIAGRKFEPDSLQFSTHEKFKTIDVGFALQIGCDLYVTKEHYFSVGLSSYIGFLDINGNRLKELGWYSQNDVEYQKSLNFRAGLTIGYHYLFARRNFY